MKRRRKRVITSEGSSGCVGECSGEVLGRVETMFEFTGECIGCLELPILLVVVSDFTE